MKGDRGFLGVATLRVGDVVDLQELKSSKTQPFHHLMRLLILVLEVFIRDLRNDSGVSGKITFEILCRRPGLEPP
jgi:hypothetical protein